MPITLQVETNLDLISKHRCLIEESLGVDGVYIRMKHTLEDLLDKGEIKGNDRARVVAETISNMTSSITSTAMQTALQWSVQEKELALKKEELEYQLDILSQQKEKLKNDTDGSEADKRLKQAQLIRDYGIATLNTDGDVVQLSDSGRLYEVTENTKQDTANKVKLNTQIDAQTEEVYARTHKVVADTYINHGVFTWTSLSDTGLTGVSKASTGYVTLSDLNKEVAREQAKGYTYNAWSNASTAGASMLGTIVSAEVPGITGTTIAELVNLWKNPTTNLSNLTAPNISI